MTDDHSTGDHSFASATVARHLTRGVIGFSALVGALALLPVVGPVSLLLLPASLLALRGCPTCWAVGLMQTISQGKLQRSCVDGRCALTVTSSTPAIPDDQHQVEPTQRGRTPRHLLDERVWSAARRAVWGPGGLGLPEWAGPYEVWYVKPTSGSQRQCPAVPSRAGSPVAVTAAMCVPCGVSRHPLLNCPTLPVHVAG